jgi:hypothetical protein
MEMLETSSAVVPALSDSFTRAFAVLVPTVEPSRTYASVGYCSHSHIKTKIAKALVPVSFDF